MMTAEFDLPKLEAAMARYVDEWGIDAKRVVAKQAGIFMRDMVHKAPPRNKGKTEKTMDNEIKSVFAPISRGWFGQKKAGSGRTHWLAAGPHVLTGIIRENFQDNLQSSQMGQKFYAGKGKMGRKQAEVGMRGRQHVTLLNRIVVRKGQLQQFAKRLKSRLGRLKASFAVAWGDNVVVPRGTMPGWVRRHLSGEARGSYINGLETPELPSFTIISNATGCERPRTLEVVASAISARIRAITADLALYRKGIKTADE